MTATPKLSEVLFERKEQSFSTLASLNSTVHAVEAGLQFSKGIVGHLAIVGPSGWGKTHLLNAIAASMRNEQGAAVETVSALAYESSPHRYDATSPLLLDDVQDALDKLRTRPSLRALIERRVKGGRPTVLTFTAPKLTRTIRTFLPSDRDWRIVTMGEPTPDQRVVLIQRMAASEGLTLSPRLMKVLASQMCGNGHTLSGALKRLRLSGGTWLETREVLRALALLEPFFAENSGWDLKLRILKTAERNRAHFSRVNHLDLAIFTMLKEAGISEAEVSRSTGLAPADVYQRSQRLQLQVHECDITAGNIKQFVEWVVSAIAKD